MTATSEHSQPYQPRAWWQWAAGVLLIAAAAGVMARRYLWDPASTIADLAGPMPIRVAPDFRLADRVPADHGALANANLLLITLDTTRADRLGCYGNATVATPHLDGLARSGVIFSQAEAPVPVTMPSHATMMTGLYPYHHGARCNGVFHLDESTATLAEVLAEKGYATAAVISAFVLDSRFGIARGFKEYDDDLDDVRPELRVRGPQRAADQTTPRAMEWLKTHGTEKFFLWVHYFDPHTPYRPPAPYSETYRDRLYDGEVAFMDSQIGELLAQVRTLGLADNTLVVVAGDHGEALNQHEEWTHGCLIYESTMQVPFMMSCGSRLGGGVHVHRPVSLVDLMPTTLALLGIDSPGKVDGIDLTRPIPQDRPLFLETMEGFIEYGFAPLLGVREGNLKYIHGPNPELYDLARDPYEERDLAGKQPDQAAKLKQRLAQLFGADLVKATIAQPTRQVTEEELAKLEALGYATDGSSTIAPPSAELPDPRTMMALKRRVEGAINEWRDRDLDKLIGILQKEASENPDAYLVHWHLGEMLGMKGELDGAVAAFERCLQIRPNLLPTLQAMAQAESVRGRYDKALEYYDEFLKTRSNHFGANFESGRLLAFQGKNDQAIERLKKAFDLRPTDAAVTEELVNLMTASARGPEAMALLENALKAKPKLVAARNSLAGLLRSQRRFADAIAVLREGVASAPDVLELQNNLAFLLATCPDVEHRKPHEASQLIEEACVRTEYKKPEYVHTLSVVYGSLYRWDEAIAMGEKAQRLAQETDQTALAQSIERTLTEYRNARSQGISPMLKGRPGPAPTSRPVTDAKP